MCIGLSTSAYVFPLDCRSSCRNALVLTHHQKMNFNDDDPKDLFLVADDGKK